MDDANEVADRANTRAVDAVESHQLARVVLVIYSLVLDSQHLHCAQGMERRGGGVASPCDESAPEDTCLVALLDHGCMLEEAVPAR